MLFSNFTCVQCTRRLNRLAQSSKSLNNRLLRQVAPQLSHKRNPLLATRSPYSTAPSRNPVRQVLTRDTFTKVRFTRAAVPPLEFWKTHTRAPLATDLSADECLQAAQAYVDAALKGASGWRERLIVVNDNSTAQSSDSKGKGKTISAYTLHYVAVIFLMAQVKQAGHLILHILHTLAGLDYTPSILTMVRIALQRRTLGQPQFELAFERFERIIKRIGDGSSNKSISKSSKSDLAADACTLRALIYTADNTHESDNNALRWFRRAYEIDAAASESSIQPTPSTIDQARIGEKGADEVDASRDSEGVQVARFNPHWQWKVSFAIGVAKIRMKRGEMEKARDMCVVASSELDSAIGYFTLAAVLEKMSQNNTDRYVESIEKAAVSGDQHAARKMGVIEWDRAVEEGLSKWEKRKRQVIAEEWMFIASSTVPVEG